MNENILIKDKLIIKLQKLKVLAERGEDGEKINALKMLENLCKKYKIKTEELISNDINKFELRWPNSKDSYRIFVQAIFSVIGNENVLQNKTERKLFLSCNNAEFIEITEKCKYFWKIYKSEKENFFIAFCLKHDLFSKESSGSECNLTKEEIKKIRNILNALNDSNYVKTTKLLDKI